MVYMAIKDVLLLKSPLKTQLRFASRNVGRNAAKEIRRRFLDYFTHENGHQFVKSSPVVPLCDPTVAFVNAGMNQFKGILLGTQIPEFTQVANTQKCVRVGGKHNDLNIVGTDGYHHTFFEMLGNWSFNQCDKNQACKYAWELLTETFMLSPHRLYVTYFNGDEKLGIPADTETKEIWKSLGVSDNRILPFGCKDNFWEMGLTGPCGPCTEIHVDSIGFKNRAEFVNKGLHDLIEVWNLVFVQYNRLPDGSIVNLPNKHLDTGMGFERLTSVLQGKISDYDTDNFLYIIDAISKSCKNLPKYSGQFGEKDWDSLDTSYRILADHARMITVCLADGVIPEQNQKFRRILRKSILLSQDVFKVKSGLIKELSNYILEELSNAYPEMEKSIKRVHQILDYEEEVFEDIRRKATKEWKILSGSNPKLQDLNVLETPNLVAAYKELSFINPTKIDGKLAFKLYDTYGLDEDNIAKLSEALDMQFNPKDFMQEFELAKAKSKEGSVVEPKDDTISKLVKFPKTDDQFKYNYGKVDGVYTFPSQKVKILTILDENGDTSQQLKTNQYGSILLDSTNVYWDAGGQTGDIGVINFNDGAVFEILQVENLNGYVLHKGICRSKQPIEVNMNGSLFVNEDERLKKMRNHTAVHLLNAAIQEKKGATCQKSSKVTDNFLNLDVAIFSSKLNVQELKGIEDRINAIIRGKLPVRTLTVNSQGLLKFDQITVIPGEIYPEADIRVIEVDDKEKFLSREPCCGTHVLNTGDIEDFCVVTMKSLGRSTVSIMAVTNERAKMARENAALLEEDILQFKKTLPDNLDNPDMLNMVVLALKQRLNYTITDNSILPLDAKNKCSEMLNEINKQIKGTARDSLKDFIQLEMQNAIETNVKRTKTDKEYIVHYLRSSMMLQSVSLQTATRMCPNLPVLVIAYADNMVKARCCVPKELRNEQFNAEIWLKNVAKVFHSRVAPPKGQDGTLVANMKPKKVSVQEWDTLLNECMENAENYIQQHLN